MNRLNVESLRKIFEREGFCAMTAVSGPKALQIFRVQPVQCRAE